MAEGFKITVDLDELLVDLDDQIGDDDELANFVMDLDEQRQSWDFTIALYKKLLGAIEVGRQEEPERFKDLDKWRAEARKVHEWEAKSVPNIIIDEVVGPKATVDNSSRGWWDQ